MCLKKLFDGNGQEHKLDSEKIGDLEKLNTNAKDNLVSAVNEVNNLIPKVTAEQNGSFVRVVNGVLTVQHLTDVSEVEA